MMSDDRTTAFAHDGGMRNALRIANLHDTVDDVASILIQRVVRRAVECRPGTIIVDTKTSSDIQIAQLVAHLLELRITARRLLGSTLDRSNIGNLRTDMKVHELERLS